MATILLAAAGSAIGGAIGGTVLGLSAAAIGQAIGATIGGAIDAALLAPNQPIEGPRLDDLKFQNGSYGAPIPRAYGSVRIAGNVIWCPDLIELSTSKKVGSFFGIGGTRVTNYSYRANVAIAVCEGPIEAITRIWADGKVVYEFGKYDAADSIRVHRGTENQNPDPLIQAIEGVDATPPYRGTAYVVFENLRLEDFGNRIPNFTFEVSGSAFTEALYPEISIAIDTTQSVDKSALIGLVDKITYEIGGGVVQLAYFSSSGSESRVYNLKLSSEVNRLKSEINALSFANTGTKLDIGLGLVRSFFSDENNKKYCYFISGGRGLVDVDKFQDLYSKKNLIMRVCAVGGNPDFDTLDAIASGIPVGAEGNPENGILDFGYDVRGIEAARDGKLIDLLQRLEITPPSAVSGIVADQLNRCGFTPADYDLTGLSGGDLLGYVLASSASARAAIEPLQIYAPFDLVESGGVLRAVRRHPTVDLDIPDTHLGARADGDGSSAPIIRSRMQELDLPKDFTITFLDPARDYQESTYRAARLTGGGLANVKASLPIAMTPGRAKRIAEQRLFTAWVERDRVSARLPLQYLLLDPGDVVSMAGLAVRVTSCAASGGIVELTGLLLYGQTYEGGQSVVDSVAASQSYTPPAPSSPLILDIPLLSDGDDQPGVYAAVAAVGARWGGAELLRSTGGIYKSTATLGERATFGASLSALPSGQAVYIDAVRTVDVQISHGELRSVTEAELLAGENLALLGSEIFQFQNADLVSPGVYRLSRLLRGRRGTEWAVSGHAAGEQFVLLDTAQFIPLSSTDLNAAADWKSVTTTLTEGSAAAVSATATGEPLRPFSPVHVSGRRSSGDLTISWIRRSRLAAEWSDFVDAPLAEAAESYEVDVLRNGNVVRTLSSTSPSVVYTAAQQIADFGSAQSSISVRIYQMSSRVGRGRPADAIL